MTRSGVALANFLAQSVIRGWIFYGYGLGRFGRYRFGPVEWFWRTCMYGVLQPMQLRENAAQAVNS